MVGDSMTLVVDGAQQLLVMTLEDLVSSGKVEVPDMQREVSDMRVQDIVASQRLRMAGGAPPLFIGPLTVGYEDGCDKWWLLDGQHRYRAMCHLRADAPTYCVAILVIRLSKQSLTMGEAFTTINRSQPVPDYVIHNTLNYRLRLSLEEFARLVQHHYHHYLSPSRSPRRPNINLDTLKDGVSANAHLHSLLPGDLFDFLRWYNGREELQSQDVKNAARARAKSVKHGCAALYITCDVDSAWLRDPSVLDAYHGSSGGASPARIQEEDAQIESSRASTGGSRRSLPSSVRNSVWNRWCGEKLAVSKCHVCGIDIHIQNYDCGHVVAKQNNGTDSVDNLRPVCRPCNLSMGTMDMNQFISQFHGRQSVVDQP